VRRVLPFVLVCVSALPGGRAAADAGAVADAGPPAATSVRPGENLAFGRTYTLSPPPNHSVGIAAGDSTNLTDGAYVGAEIVPGSVVWRGAAAVRIDLDLGTDGCAADGKGCAAIGEIFFQVLERPRGGIFCPRRVVFEVSDDGVVYHKVRELRRPDDCVIPNPVCSLRGGRESGRGGPEFQANYIVTSGPLGTRGAHVRLTIEPTPFLSIDEVEVRAGNDPTLTNDLPEIDFESALGALGPDWRVFPGGPWDVANARTLPPAGVQDAVEVRFALAGGETGAAALRITNPRAAPLALTTDISPLQGPGESRLPGGAIRVRQAIDVETELFEARADALVSLRHSPARLAGKSVGHLFLEAAVPPEQAAGLYRGTLQLTGGEVVKTIPIVLQVRPFTLQPRRDLRLKFFDYSYAIPENDPYRPGGLANERAALRKEYGENADVSYLTPRPSWRGRRIQAPDFRIFGEDLKRQEAYSGLHLLFVDDSNPDVLHFQGHACYPSRQWNAAYAFWMGSIRRFMESQGIPPDRYALYLMDEPRTGSDLPCFGKDCEVCKETERDQFDVVRDAAAIAHEAGLRVFLNPAESRQVEGKGLRSLVGKVDIFCPPGNFYDWERACLDPEQLSPVGRFYRDLQAAGQTVFTYGGNLSRSSAPALPGRTIGWRLFRDRLGGYGYWAMYAVRDSGALRTSLWDPFDGEPGFRRGALHDYGTVYLTRKDDPRAPEGLPDDEAIIPSRRLAAMRQGMEDYRYLDRLQQLLEARKDRADTSGPRAILKQAVDDVLSNPDDPAAYDRARDQVAGAIEALLREPARN
jgi:hypothetical protein